MPKANTIAIVPITSDEAARTGNGCPDLLTGEMALLKLDEKITANPFGSPITDDGSE
jgi:hypothetical protein